MTVEEVTQEVAEQEANLSAYQRLCQLANINPLTTPIEINEFSEVEVLANKTLDERLTAALQVFVEMAAGNESIIDKVDKVLLDHYIARIDKTLSEQIDEILHDN